MSGNLGYSVTQNSNSYAYGLGESFWSQTQLNNAINALANDTGLVVVGADPSDSANVYSYSGAQTTVTTMAQTSAC